MYETIHVFPYIGLISVIVWSANIRLASTLVWLIGMVSVYRQFYYTLNITSSQFEYHFEIIIPL